MEYTPRYPQPFTFWQAVQLDVPIITEGTRAITVKVGILRYTQTLSPAIFFKPNYCFLRGTFLQPRSANDILFGNIFSHPLNLPWGSSAALSFMR